MYFTEEQFDIETLKQTAHNLRWAVQPEGVIPLTAADPDFPVALPIRETISRYASRGHFHYGPVHGLPRFKEALSCFFQSKRNIGYEPCCILPTDSAAAAIELVCKALLRPGDEAIILDPVDFLFRFSIEAFGATAIPFKTGGPGVLAGFTNMLPLITEATRLICLCNPVNPTGKVFSREELLELVKVAEAKGILILSDEVWSDIVYTPHEFTSIASLTAWSFRNTITITGFSKSYGLAGLRIGALAVGRRDLYDLIFMQSGYSTTTRGVLELSQWAAIAALEEAGEWLSAFKSHLTVARNYCVDRLNSMPGLHCISPEGCFVAFVDVRETGMDSLEFTTLLKEQAKVAVVPGLPEWFGAGAEGFIRISFASSIRNLEQALDRINHTILSI